MTRHDLRWIGLRGTGFFFLAKAILTTPALIHCLRVQEAILGPAASDASAAFHPVFTGVSGLATHVAVYAVAAAALFLIPVGRAG